MGIGMIKKKSLFFTSFCYLLIHIGAESFQFVPSQTRVGLPSKVKSGLQLKDTSPPSNSCVTLPYAKCLKLEMSQPEAEKSNVIWVNTEQQGFYSYKTPDDRDILGMTWDKTLNLLISYPRRHCSARSTPWFTCI